MGKGSKKCSLCARTISASNGWLPLKHCASMVRDRLDDILSKLQLPQVQSTGLFLCNICKQDLQSAKTFISKVELAEHLWSKASRKSQSTQDIKNGLVEDSAMNFESFSEDDDAKKLRQEQRQAKIKLLNPADNIIRCCGCEEFLSNLESVQRHSEIKHFGNRRKFWPLNAMKPFECEFCFNRFASSAQLEEHQQKLFEAEYILRKHQHRLGRNSADTAPFSGRKSDGFNSKAGLLKCDFCTDWFGSKRAFRKHKLIHRSSIAYGNIECSVEQTDSNESTSAMHDEVMAAVNRINF
ncbi:zinc finger protein 587B-like [Uranotaenia lowii]|uniref:zinc finger protein 587B-like n=1 Tax=Uranotaenia lowii TaxID=190385 RepID=UPI00247A67DE|nr:zinc finger protein 587B-like [Uranotaenia lowii]